MISLFFFLRVCSSVLGSYWVTCSCLPAVGLVLVVLCDTGTRVPAGLTILAVCGCIFLVISGLGISESETLVVCRAYC